MGLTKNMIQLILSSQLKSGVSFNKMVMIGRQNLHLNVNQLSDCFIDFNLSVENVEEVLSKYQTYSELFFQKIGANSIDSIDASDYEKATIIHDMNLPIDEKYKNQYDLVLDSGTLEHVFNFPQAIKNCMQLIKISGHFIGIYPCNNFFGHGFYQFSSELFYRTFSKENGFKILDMVLFVDEPNPTFYSINDTCEINTRVMFTNSKPVYIYINAMRLKEVGIFNTFPIQMDYSEMKWKGIKIKSNIKPRNKTYKDLIPFYIKNLIKAIINKKPKDDSLNFKKPFFTIYNLK